MGFWVPNRVYATVKFLAPLRQHMNTLRDSKNVIPLHGAVASFKVWVTSNSTYRMWVNSMIDQANAFVQTLDDRTKAEIETYGDIIHIADYDEFFEILNVIIHTSPSFNDTVQVGTPMNAFLAVSMGTQAGVALFHDAMFNSQFKTVLNAWNQFLKSSQSLDKLDINDPEKPGSWISKAAFEANVWNQMQYDSTKPGYGFDSWNSFFIRPFIDGARPFMGDAAQVVNVGCETTPWAYMDSVAYETDFWVKDVQYSLLDLFGGRQDKAAMFAGGQAYQGFLSATHYHRWNSPVTGQLVASWLEPGTYFAQRPSQGETVGTWEGTESQPYLGHVAARAIFIFNHPVCGYIAMICIGMVEVSTCVIEPAYLIGDSGKPKDIARSVEIGHFEFGGSTHILLFQKDKVVLAEWACKPLEHHQDKQPTAMGTVIAIPSPQATG